MEAAWVAAFALDALPRGEARVFTRGELRVAVFRLDDDALFALDDRCPHEGYPLAKGFVNGCVVTCRWHAFRYDLRTGRCLVGDEHARTYPVRVREGVVELDLRPPDREAEGARIATSLVQALAWRKTGQMARDAVRLIDLGVTLREVAFEAVRFDAARGAYGTTHVPALAHDLLVLLPRLTERHGPDGELATLLMPLDLAAESHLGYADRARPEPEAWPVDGAFVELRRRVEAEDADGAEALLRGAIAQSASLETLRGWFRTLVTDHLIDFGHGQIYLPKVFALLAGAARADVDLVLGAYLRMIALGTREELVPEWSWVARAIAEVPEPSATAVPSFLRALLDGSRRELFSALEGLLGAGQLVPIIDALVVAASVRLLRYDLQIETDPTVQDGWLDITHALTLASATRELLAPDDPAGNRRILYLVSAFVHTRGGADAPRDLRVFDEAAVFADTAPAPSPEPGPAADPDAVQHALERRDADAMVRVCEPFAHSEPTALVTLLEDWCLTRGATRPIFATHQWKTLVAAQLERDRLAASADPATARAAHLPLLAAARFLASPLAERSPMRVAHEALRFVRHGRVPRRRT